MSKPLPAGRSVSAPSASAPRAGSRRKAARGPNPLLIEADALLALAPELRATTSVADLARLHAKIAEMLRDFELRARVRGIGAARIARAQAVLGALTDDVVASMPWGADAGWQPLAPAPSDKPSLARLAQEPAVRRLISVAGEASGDRDLQELICVALCLGFDGRARDAAVEADTLAQLRAQLAAQLRDDGAGAVRALSPQWLPAVNRGGALASWLPLWVLSLMAAALLAVLYFSLALSLGVKSDRVYAQIAALRPASASPAQPVPASQPRLAAPLSALMSAPASAQRLAVRDDIDQSVVVVPEQILFEAGTATLRPAGIEILRPIATALQTTPGRVRVIGHTDGRAARSARYPSDWDLAVDRARSVRDALHALGIAEQRLAFDGRADTEPVRTAGGGNGRVEIVLLAGR